MEEVMAMAMVVVVVVVLLRFFSRVWSLFWTR